MDKGEIARDYAASKNHKRQIQILAELNACPKEKIVEILQEKGYKMVFNTNGVDVSLKSEEIHAAYRDGKTVKELSKQYYVSVKGVKEILGITEGEDMNNENVERSNDKEVVELRHEIQKLTVENNNLKKQIDSMNVSMEKADRTCKEMEAEICSLKSTIKELEIDELHEKYQFMCIKNNQLNATIDTLIDKISMLKAVGCNGR